MIRNKVLLKHIILIPILLVWATSCKTKFHSGINNHNRIYNYKSILDSTWSAKYHDFYVVDTIIINNPLVLTINNDICFVSDEEHIADIIVDLDKFSSSKQLDQYLHDANSKINSPDVFYLLRPQDSFVDMYSLSLRISQNLQSDDIISGNNALLSDEQIIKTIDRIDIGIMRFIARPNCFAFGLVSVKTFSDYWNPISCPPKNKWRYIPSHNNYFNNFLTLVYPIF